MEQLQNKANINLVVIGNVDSGKSTTCGQLLYKLGQVSTRDLSSLQKEAENRKKNSFFLAYVMDKSKDSRDRGITIDISMKKFQSEKYSYTLIDAPGHKNFVKNMITGTQQADIALLMVSSHKGEFESGFAQNGQTKEHAMLAYALGVKRVIVCVNKMDVESVNYSEARFKEIKEEVEFYLKKKVGFKSITTIPISGYNGDNLLEKSTNMPWYEGQSLIEVLDSFPEPKRPLDKPLRVPIQQVYKIQGIGTVVSGKVEAGILKPDMEVVLYPSGKITKVLSIEAHNQSLKQATPGDVVGINLRNVTVKEVSKGAVLCSPQFPCKASTEFIAQVIVLQGTNGIKVGYTPTISCHVTQFACEFQQFMKKIDMKTGKEIISKSEDMPEVIKGGECVLVKMKSQKDVVIEPYGNCPGLGRFVIRDMGKIVAVGVVKELL